MSLIRRLPSPELVLHLTFDDGPASMGTRETLDLLRRHGVRATFFLVAEKARQNEGLVRAMVDEGHTLGNHSLDHRYGVFFRGTQAMKAWIEEAEQVFDAMGLPPRVGFRPPNGILTPKVFAAARELRKPLILWNLRFYDSLWPWTRAKAERALARLKPGSIVLLHDVQRPQNQKLFLETLEYFINESRRRGYRFEPLTLAATSNQISPSED
ncbi:MAG: polysaccharide deacetylase family protein [Bdellovibrionaceae bacterium]|nr:polysaccharide deacetylase family protein [Pseudobdellovibrionaceae bacterium]